ncbi:MAG: fructose-6-phosphate aldolase [archaeon]|nr:fructose-6-phosphate aldolase [archaeon]HIK01185.1 fructose-6-phosphate aldolase [Candidatus Undinarchaeales archaeon ERR594346 U_76725]|tara:strand:- start:11963 stop:12607 length:645 start_codon:yes stop_codon:yes gene_type:complete
MKFFIDSADIEEIRKAKSYGIVDGVTTNPSLLAKMEKGRDETVKDILSESDWPVSIEVISTDTEGMLKEAYEIAKLRGNAVVKIPMTLEGLAATKELSSKGIRTNVTLVFSANQALLAAKAGASYVSPFVGRLDDRGEDGMQLIRDIVQIYQNYGLETEVLVASIRSEEHVLQAALAGAHVSTVPMKVLENLAKHELTDAGLEKFLEDWKNRKK